MRQPVVLSNTMKERNISLILFTTINIFSYLDRFLVSAVLPAVQKEFQLTDANAGLLVSAFTFGYFLFSPLFGFLGDRKSRPLLMAIGISVWSLATIFTGFSLGFWSFLLIRLFVGIGEAAFGSIAPGYIKDWKSEAFAVNRALSVFFTAIPVGSALGFILGGFFAEYFSWRAAFFVGGVPGIILSYFLLRVPEIRRAPVATDGILRGVRTILSDRFLCLIIAGYILNTFALTGIATFVTKYGERIGFTLGEIGTYFGVILVVTGLVGTLGGGRLIAYAASRTKDPVAAMIRLSGINGLLGVPLVAWAFSTQDHTLFLVFCFFSELVLFAGMAPVNSALVMSCPPHLVTLTQGVTIFAINLFGYLPSPWIVGLLSDSWSLPLAMQLLSFALLFSSMLWIYGGVWGRPRPLVGHDK